MSLAVRGFPISSQSQSVCILKCVLIKCVLIKDNIGFVHILNLGMETCFTQVCRCCTCAQDRGFASNESVIIMLKAIQSNIDYFSYVNNFFPPKTIFPPGFDLKRKLAVEEDS